jgi:hypothetical protein
MSKVELTQEEYDSLIYKVATLENEIGQARMLLEAPAKAGWWRRFWGMGTKALVVVVVVVFCFVVGVGYGREAKNIAKGFGIVKIYRGESEAFRIGYVTGVMDGIALAPMFGAPETNMKWVNNCLVGMDGNQVTAIVDKYLKDHPESWHVQLNALVYSALIDVCNK